MPALFEKLFAFFFRGGDPRTLKKKAMKQLAKELSGNRYSRFYRPKTSVVEPPLAAFFFELYRTVSHAHIFLNNAAKSELLKELTVETFLDIRYLDARQRLSAEYVKERAKTIPITEVSRLLEDDFDLLSSGIDNELMAAADRCYNQILTLVNFSSFDFFFFLKKFDPGLVENNFNLRPHFSPVPGRHLCGQIKDFLEVSRALDTEEEWGPPLRVLKLYKNGTEVISPEEWDTLASRLRELGRSNILELMIRHIEENPSWRFDSSAAPVQHIASNYLEDREREVRNAMNGFVRDRKLLGAKDLARTVFGDPDIRRAIHYTPQESDAFVKRGLDGYTCAEGFNYIKAFLLDVFKKEMQGLCELLLIRGHWYSMEFSQQMSESYHVLIDTAARIDAFDDSLGEDGETGSRLRAMLAKADRDKSQLRYIKNYLKKINEDALEFINLSAQALIVIGTTIKNVLEDRKSGAGELIVNWKELEFMAEPSLIKCLITAHKQISGLLQILRLLSGLESETEGFGKDKAGQSQP
ncbi:MAG: DUF5312 domain-containing protein [Treponema sp.]|jgi:hypothetical protein|nr:DUF5312 domain-containing protein [Treponema sp.]